MRLFIALDIDDAVRERISRFVEGVQGFAPDARWMKPESLHVTLKFIGEQPEPAVEQIKEALKTVSSSAMPIQFRGYGFFPTAKSARVFWIGMEAGPQLASLAARIDEKLTDEKLSGEKMSDEKTTDEKTAPLRIAKEARAFSPHLTLARGSGGSGSPKWRKADTPNRVFQHLQEKLASLPAPEFGTMTPRGFFLYQSELSPKGSKYTKLERFELLPA
jgi:RNA 2',3'-cyclic 3'-phosphodiesterase